MQGPRPEYTFPARFIVRWLWSWARRRGRHLGEDGTWLLARHAAAPHVIAAERIPARDGFILVMNHYEPAGLRVWWPALSVSGAVGARRSEAPALRWLIADRFFQTRWHGVPIPDGVVAWAFRQLARTYGLIVVSRSDARARAIALRRAARALRDHEGLPRPLAVTPEGALASGGVLAIPVPNAAIALAWLSRGETPLLPVAVYRDASTRLTISVGEPFTLPWRGLRATRASGDALTRQVMGALAALLPAELRGPFGEVPDGAAPAPGNADAGDQAMQGDRT